jgi:DNA (cytosine-5)-methyltransferase 1
MSLSLKQFNFVDLFAGIGGMRLAFESAGGRCVLTCEIDEDALKTYRANFSPLHSHEYVRDVKDVQNLPPYEVLVAGFPCQPYSIAGLRQGLNDVRGQVFLEIIRILKESKPKAFLLENVKGMRSHDGGRTFNFMLEELAKCGYYLRDETLNSAVHSNVPQNRERVFVVGFRDETAANRFEFPKPIRLTKTIKSCINNLVRDQKYFYDQRFGCFADIAKVVTSSDTVYQWRRKYVRENKSNVCPALTANMGSGGHNVPLIRVESGIRKLTPRECAKFQGFPTDFVFPNLADSKLYHQFGNSVTVPLIERIAKAMISAMK